MKKKDTQKPIPDVITDAKNRVSYRRGAYLGKGGFARCYELIDKEKNVFAGKAVAKAALMKPSNKEKMSQEIAIHQALEHRNIVKMHCFFEDTENIYMVLELCSNRSMMELHKRRGYVTEPEARYFMVQTVAACQYLHERLIIHRDLKLGNIFLNERMHIKVGDFGLATKLNHRDERKDTLCGTPNYIAPEMLQRKKHSFEVDIWALGCILYTLLCGRPPFETSSLQETYSRIKRCAYNFPSVVGVHASEVITQLLHPDCFKRPRVHDIQNFTFFTHGYIPRELPRSCLSSAPKLDSTVLCGGNCDSRLLTNALHEQKPLVVPSKTTFAAGDAKPTPQVADSMIIRERVIDGQEQGRNMAILLNEHITNLLNAVHTNSENNGPSVDVCGNTPDLESESPQLTPVYYISKWVDYSDKYGFGYQLADGSVGVMFNDSTRIMIDRTHKNVTYTERHGNEKYFTTSTTPKLLHKKMTLLQYFINYMKDQLMEGANVQPEVGSELSRPPVLNNWFRSQNGINLSLSNGTIQINCFRDHCKLILCPMVQACTVIKEDRNLHTYAFKTLVESGCSKDLYDRLVFAKKVTEKFIQRFDDTKQ